MMLFIYYRSENIARKGDADNIQAFSPFSTKFSSLFLWIAQCILVFTDGLSHPAFGLMMVIAAGSLF